MISLAGRSHVRVVAPDEVAQPAKPKSLGEAIESGDYLEILLAQRRDIVASLPDEKGPAKAALHRQLSLISKEITALQLVESEDHSVVASTPDEAWDGTGY